MNHDGRLQIVQRALRSHKLDGLLISHPPNLRYLCGFTGSTGVLLVSPEGSVFFTDGRYGEQARSEVRGAKIGIGQKPPLTAAATWLGRRVRAKSWRAIGVEAEHFTMAARRRLLELLPKQIRLQEAPPLVERARMVKDDDEVKAIRAAVGVGAELFDRALEVIRPGVREIEVAAEMEYAARRKGADAMSFETIIASGARSALPHGRASAAVIGRGFVVCDCGVILHGYCSDRTRTVYVGSAPEEAQRLYGAVLEAQAAAIAAVAPGVSVGHVDRAARKVLQGKGLAKYFTHSTGHGVGLEVHEAPRVAKGQQEILRPGMVITIEPGVYLLGKWGVRIEDMVVVTEEGSEALTSTQKELIVI